MYLAILTFVLICLNLILYIVTINYKSEYKRAVKTALAEMMNVEEIEAFIKNNNLKRVGNLVYILNYICRLE